MQKDHKMHFTKCFQLCKIESSFNKIKILDSKKSISSDYTQFGNASELQFLNILTTPNFFITSSPTGPFTISDHMSVPTDSTSTPWADASHLHQPCSVVNVL